MVLSLKARGIGVLITDHNVRETLRICDRAYLIHEGKVLTEGTGEFLVNDEKARTVYLSVQSFNSKPSSTAPTRIPHSLREP